MLDEALPVLDDVLALLDDVVLPPAPPLEDVLPDAVVVVLSEPEAVGLVLVAGASPPFDAEAVEPSGDPISLLQAERATRRARHVRRRVDMG